jgi:hypothetical protein
MSLIEVKNQNNATIGEITGKFQKTIERMRSLGPGYLPRNGGRFRLYLGIRSARPGIIGTRFIFDLTLVAEVRNGILGFHDAEDPLRAWRPVLVEGQHIVVSEYSLTPKPSGRASIR